MTSVLRPNGDGPAPLVLLVDDDESFRAGIRRLLERAGYRVEGVADGRACLNALDRVLPDVVLLDLNMEGLGGLATLRAVRERLPELPVVMLTGESDVATVVEAMHGGAWDYLQKPPEPTRLMATLRNAVERRALGARLRELEREAAGGGYGEMIGTTPAMRDLFRQLDRVGPSDVTVLIAGESGSGKELVARAIHQHSARRAHPFVAINCAAIPESLQESELFGHERGAFTGAVERRVGRFEQAHQGTLFLDEVGELSPSLQAKLLRVLQERSFYRVGGTVAVQVDVRILSATHRDLLEDVRVGRFREDLYYRLAVYEVDVPPLRARREDIPRLAARFVAEFSTKHDRAGMRLGADTLDVLVAHDWPGNVRELRNALERAVVSASTETIRPADLPPRLRLSSPSAPPRPLPAASPTSIRDLERVAIEEALVAHAGNVSEVCRALGIPRTTFYRKVKRYRIPLPRAGEGD